MPTTAKKILEENKKGTIFDESFIGQCKRKYATLLEGADMPNERIKGITAVLMENQMQYLSGMAEDTLSTNVGSFVKYIFPILRRVFPNLIANQIVSVQPMNSPVGGVFYHEYKYGDRKGTKDLTQGAISNNPYDQNYDGELNDGDEFIKNFGRYYSSEYVDYDVICTDGGGNATVTESTNNGRPPSFLPIRTPGTDAQRTFSCVAYARTSEGTRILTADTSGNFTDQDTNATGSINFTTGAFTLNAILAAGGATTFIANTVIYLVYYYESEKVYTTANAKNPSMSLEVTLQEIKAETHKLITTWSVEANDDLRALHGIDAEIDLVSGIANEIALEIDRKIITDLLNNVMFTGSYAIQYDQTDKPHTEMDAIRGLLTQIDAISAYIHRGSGRAPANFLVISPTMAGIFNQLTSSGLYQNNVSSVVPPTYGPMTANFGVMLVGTLMNKYAVYQDPYAAEGDILIGLRGAGYLDAGYVFAPYIPLQATPTFTDPETFVNKKGLWSRYATKVLRKEYYGKLTVTGLPSVTITP